MSNSVYLFEFIEVAIGVVTFNIAVHDCQGCRDPFKKPT